MEHDPEYQALSASHKTVISNFFKFAKQKRDRQQREVEGVFKDVRETRLLDTTFTNSEVNSILSDLFVLLKPAFTHEFETLTASIAESLKDVCKQAEGLGASVSSEFSGFDNEETRSKNLKLEGSLLAAAPAKKLGALEPVGGGSSLRTQQELTSAKNENEQLKASIARLQQELVTASQEKVDIDAKLRGLKTRLQQAESEITSLAKERDEAKAKAQAAAAAPAPAPAPVPAVPAAPTVVVDHTEVAKRDAEIAELTKKVADLTKSLQDSEESTKRKTKMLQDQVQILKDSVRKKGDEIEAARKEAVGKLNETSQFKSLKKMVSTKNDQIKQLRDRLAKYEPQAAEGGIELEAESSSEEDEQNSDDDF